MLALSQKQTNMAHVTAERYNEEMIHGPQYLNLLSACIRKMAEEVRLLLCTLTCLHTHQKTLHGKLSCILHISHIFQLSLPVN